MLQSVYKDIRTHGFYRVAVAVPVVEVANPAVNARTTLELVKEANASGVQYLLFPELGITGYTCGDLFHNSDLLYEARAALEEITRLSRIFATIFSVGVPLLIQGGLYNCAVTIQGGKILRITPKSYPPEYREFYELRHFLPAALAHVTEIELYGQLVPFGTDILVHDKVSPYAVIYEDICEDIWLPVPPGAIAALNGAFILGNLSASNITIGKSKYRHALVAGSSGRNLAAQLYTAAGPGESTTDHGWDGDACIAERGDIIKVARRFQRQSQFYSVDIDLEVLAAERMRQTSFHYNAAKFRQPMRTVSVNPTAARLGNYPAFHFFHRPLSTTPFVPVDDAELRDHCFEVYNIQVQGLVRRLEALPEDKRKMVIGVSGGKDSAHALTIAAQAADVLKIPRTDIIALTMPGFGTTMGTKQVAHDLMDGLGVTKREISIERLARCVFQLIDHAEDKQDITYENTQAWCRKVLELATGAENGGIVLGTGNLTELAMGWCTMYGDHASHYNVNGGVAKTLITFLMKWSTTNIFQYEPKVAHALLAIAKSEISPELLPPGEDGKIMQKSEDTIGPIVLVDFFLAQLPRYGRRAMTMLRLAEYAFAGEYDRETLRKWLTVFFRRFIIMQYKRSVMADGPKVGLVCLSPRGDWRMPSDISPDLWLKALAEVPESE